ALPSLRPTSLMEGRGICAPATEGDTGERSKNERNTVVHPYVAAGAEGRGVRLQGATRGGGRVPLGLLTTSPASVLQGDHPAAQKEKGGGLPPPPYLFNGTHLRASRSHTSTVPSSALNVMEKVGGGTLSFAPLRCHSRAAESSSVGGELIASRASTGRL